MTKTSPINKLAIIRSMEVRQCPYGLPITAACKHVGEAIDQMVPLAEVPKEQKEKYQKANRRVYVHSNTNQRCPFADKIAENEEAVHCDYGEGGARQSDFPIRPSPYYPRMFNGMGQYGLYSYPITFWMDDEGARNNYTGMFSIYADTNEIPITKNTSINFDPDKEDSDTESK